MKPYKFTSKAQDDAKIKEIKKLKEEKESMKGKKLLKEATFSVTTIEDALQTIGDCMVLISMKKRNVLALTDLIGSAIVSGSDAIAYEITGKDDTKVEKVSTLIKKKLMMIIRSSMVF